MSDRVSSIHRLLHDAVEAGSEQGVVTAFAEAMLAWDGVEVRGYVEDVDGNLSLAVCAPGAERGHVSIAGGFRSIDASGGMPVSISPDDLQQFGLPSTLHALAMEVGGGVEPWLLLFCDGFGSPDRLQLGLSLDPLRDALGEVSTIAETRLAWSLLHPLFGAATANVEQALTRSLAAMARACDARDAALTVTAPEDVVALRVGGGEGGIRPSDPGRRLLATAPLPERHRLTLMISCEAGHVVTRREQHLADRAAAILAGWLSPNFHAVIASARRQAEANEVQQLFERTAARNLRDGVDVSLFVFTALDPQATLGSIDAVVADLRTRLRGTDIAGMLSDREVGVLAAGVTPLLANGIGERLRRGLEARLATPLTVGVVCRNAGSPSSGTSLVDVARLEAGRQGRSQEARAQ